MYGDKTPLRIFHAKTIGLVEAKIVVETNLPESLRAGLFRYPGTYNAWIRFTNSSTIPSPDKSKAVRGMAIKVLDVHGTQYLDNTKHSGVQDIILSNSRTFAPGSGSYALSAVKLLLGTLPEKIVNGIRIGARYLKGALLFLKYPIVTPNILEEMYYSGTPYAFGKDRSIKWHARPLKTITSVIPEHPKDDFLRNRLISDLAEEANDPVAFGLFVQFQENNRTEPIDDSTVVWKTPFHLVATIILPKQHLDTAARRKLDKEMSFCPGNAIVEHAPLGSINKIRVEVYGEMAKHRLAQHIQEEPQPA